MKVCTLLTVYSLIKPPKDCNVNSTEALQTLIGENELNKDKNNTRREQRNE